MSFTKLCGIALLVFAVGCKKAPPEVPEPEPEPVPAPAPVVAPEPAPVEEFGPMLDAVHFETGVMTVEDSQMAAVNAAADVLKSSDWLVLLVGLADASGDAELNKELSQKRADAVAVALKAKGVAGDRIRAKGIGEKLATGESQSERKVEMVLFHDTGLKLKQVAIRSGVLEDDYRAKKADEAMSPNAAPAPAPAPAPDPKPAPPNYGK